MTAAATGPCKDAKAAALEARESLLRAAGWGGATALRLAGDASARRYERLIGGPEGATAVLMIAPGPDDTRRFTSMTAHLRRLGLSAPEILSADHAAGLLLLEDLGDDLFARIAADRPELEERMYERAIDLLAELAGTSPPERLSADGNEIEVPPYDATFLRFEAGLFTEWWLAAASDGAVSTDACDEFDALVADACAPVADARSALVLRDYHAENLIWLPNRPGVGAVGLLDYQDARRGHPAYDLISLLEDARRDVPPSLAKRMVAHYTSVMGMSAAARSEFAAACAILGAQRNLKIVGIFARLCLRDGKPGYLALVPGVWGRLMRDLSHPALRGLRDWIDSHAPDPSPDLLARIRLSGTLGS